ncbi:MAG: leucyl/phenylalanyl-tRNA--protein transferase [Ascidiaceihabitans sp.]|nr:leucyl/phenylalanyl-tRNA--protein transferase [Ascidiaceihabitans sp.]
MALSAELLLHGYSIGIFPMAENRDDPEIFWVDPKMRGVMPLDGLHISRSLAKRMRTTTMTVTVDQDFDAVVDGCADRVETWINPEIRHLYSVLHKKNRAHSLEVWEGDALVGGVYGVTLGAAFFGESMFSRRTDASKIALACLVELLGRGGFKLFDTQFITEHLASLGGVEISRAHYHQLLDTAKAQPARFLAPRSPQDVMQRMTQTS